MPLPPDWLVQWTEYFAALAGAIAAIKGLWAGGDAARHKATLLKHQVLELQNSAKQ